MKTIQHLLMLMLAAILGVTQIASAAVPPAINYQGRLTNAAGIPQTGVKPMSVKLHDAAIEGNLLYTENLGDVTIHANGVYAFQFGANGANGAGIPASLAAVLASSAEQWLELTVDGVAQAPRQKILAVPYALMAGVLPAGAVSSSMLADGAVNLEKLAPPLAASITAAALTSEDFTSAIPPGPFENNAAAIAAGVGINKIYRQPSGVIRWLNVDERASAYKAATGISDAQILKVSAFFEGLIGLGLNDEFLDGACYRAAANIATGTSMKSLLGLSNLTMVNSPARRRNGIYFNGVNQYATGGTVTTTGARTFMVMHTGLLSNTSVAEPQIFSLRGGTSSFALNETLSGPNIQRYSYGGVATRTISPSSGIGRNTTLFTVDSIRDDSLGGPSSFSALRLPYATNTFTRASMQGEPPHSLNNLRICLFANNNTSTIYGYAERSIQGWLLFNRALTDGEELSVNTLLGNSIFPKWRMIWEGDSISNFEQSRASDKGIWQGANVMWNNISAGGETSTNGVAQLGTGNGLNPTNLTDDMPTVVDIAFGTNDLGNFSSLAHPLATIHANLRTMWAYTRTANPAARICANTVMQSSYIFAQNREADRIALNDLIRADAGIHYDLLQDRDQWSFDATATRPVYLDPSLFVQDAVGIAVHPTLTPGGGSDLLTTYMSTNLENLGVIP